MRNLRLTTRSPFLPLLLILAAPPPETALSQFVVQHREPAGENITLTESISIPAEEAGYTLVLPDRRSARGLIVFFNADRDTAGKLFREAIPRDIGVMFVSTGNRLEFLFETDRMRQLEGYLEDVVTRYAVPRKNLMFAGMSLAGTRAAKMARFSLSPGSHSRLVPLCLAVCDAPLDFVRFWREMDRAKRLKATPVTANEGEWVTGCLERNLGGTPSTNRESYLAYSPYARESADTANLRPFAGMKVRAYTEPDVQWWMSTRRKDYYGMNALDMAGFINELNILGNADAELILTTDKGRLPDGSRHPHSWSIVDERELVDWFEKMIGK